MKRLTLTLWSCVLLFLGIGTAWAQTPTVPVPAGFTPADGATVAPGDEITFSIENAPEDYKSGTVVFVYVFGDGDVPQPTMGEIYAAFDEPGDFYFVAFMEGRPANTAAIPADVASGSLTMKVRMAVAVADADNPDADPALVYSEVATATYTVAGEVTPAPTPKFDIASNTAVEYNSQVKVSIDIPEGDNEENYWIYYVLDKPDFDFTAYSTDEAIEAAGAKLVNNGAAITRLTEATTIKAATCKYSTGAPATLFAWSEVAEATYKVKPAQPEITSDRDFEKLGFLRLDDRVELSCTTEDAKIYYTLDGSEPTAASTEYTEAIIVSQDNIMAVEGVLSLNIKAIAIKGDDKSDVATLTMPIAIEKLEFWLDGEEEALWPGAAEVATGAKVKLTTEPAGLDIYYTTDGTMPTKASTKYSADGITIDKSQIIMAVAYNGELMSYDAEGDYTPEAYAFLIKSGDGETATVDAEVFEALTFTPASGTTVKAGQELNFTVPENLVWSNSALSGGYMFYTDKEDVKLECAAEDILATINPWMYVGEPLPFYLGMYGAIYDENYKEIGMDWSSEYPVVVPEDATGTITFKARFAVMIGESLVYSPVMTATYTVDGAVEKPTAPAFYMGENKIEDAKVNAEFGAEVTLANGYPEDDNLHVMYYKVNGTAADFTTDLDALQDYSNAPLTPFYGDPIVIAKSQTILAATAKINMATKKVTWSDIVTVEFKVKPAPSPAFGTKKEVMEAEAIEIVWPENFDWAKYLDNAVIMYVENDATTSLAFDGTYGDLQALAGGDSGIGGFAEGGADGEEPASPAFKVANYDHEYDEWSPAVKLTTIGDAVTVRARLAVPVGSYSNLPLFSEEFTATFKVTERPLPTAPKFVVDDEEVADGATIELAEGAKASVKWSTIYEGVESDRSYIVVYTMEEDETVFEATNLSLLPLTAELWEIGADPIEVEAPATIGAAIAEYDETGAITWTDIVTVEFTVKEGSAIATPVITPGSGEVEKGQEVTITCATTGAYIMYTLDGTTPTMASSVYREGTPIVIDSALTLKAAAAVQGKWSEVATAVYTIKGGTTDPEKDTVATPTFSVPAGEVAKGTKVEIACATDSVKLYYTVDGSEPTAESTEYTAAITIDKAMTIKAIAIKGEVKSAVAEAAYTVKEVANEELELAGVSVYPNPSNGVFTLELPVAARVEVYGLTGVMVQRFEAGAGLLTMNIDHSGIYFLRITAEGRTTVKRIVVR